MSASTFVAADGDGYDRMMGRFSERLAEPFLDFAGVADGERVLDVGCGTGKLAFAVARRCPAARITGVDFSPKYVAHALRRRPTELCAFQVGDACALDFPDAVFDRSLALLVLHFVPKAEQAIAEMRRVTRPGGVAGAAVWDARGGFVIGRVFWDTAAALDLPQAEARRAKSYTRPMTRPGELGRAFAAAGFREVVETTLAIRMEFDSFDHYWMPFVAEDGPFADYAATLSADDRSRLREAVRRAYLDGEADGSRSFASTAWAVKGFA